jgi:predicted GNAT superfamily acetyltransferase
VLETALDVAGCARLQRACWGYADADLVPPNELISVAKAGGLVIGAFDVTTTPERPGDDMIGFCFGLLGRDQESGELYHASRMLAVHPTWRRRGVARALKHAQREATLAQGLTRMRWTFDPLRLGNARLNLETLGAVGLRYHRDLYGERTSSPLHAAGTDRIEAEWRLDRHAATPPAKQIGRVPFPVDLEALLVRDPATAGTWRDRVRAGLEEAFARGLVVLGVEIEAGAAVAHYLVGPDPVTP